MLKLVCHPNAPSRAAHAVAAQATLTREGKLALSYSLHGEPARMRIPPPGPARIGWKLWRHTCCEVFIRQAGVERYYEFNFSPSGEWAAYAFSGYREGSAITDEALNPQVAVESNPARLDLYALVDLKRLKLSGKILLGLAVIVEQDDGGLSYWALSHPPGKPDFHHAQAFALELDAVRD